MNTFTKTLIASALTFAVAGPVAATDLKVIGAYTGSKTTLKITPSGCKNWSKKNVTSAIGFGDVSDIPSLPVGFRGMAFSGCWAMTALSFLVPDDLASGGAYIQRKVDKDLTLALTGETLTDILQVMDAYLATPDAEKCDANVLQPKIITQAIVKKAQGKLSKNGDRIKVDIQVDTKYENGKGKDKTYKASIKGNMDHNPAIGNPVIDCGLVFIDPQG